MKNAYNANGISLILSAFGASENPTSMGLSPIQCANKLAKYVYDNNFDGVDIDYEDNEAMLDGTG